MSVLEFCWESQCSSGVQTGISGNFLSCIMGVKYPLRLKRQGGIFLKMLQRKGPHLALRGECPCFSQVVAGYLKFLSSSDRDLRDPLIFHAKSQASIRVASGFSGFLSSWCRGIGPPWVEAGTSGLLSRSDMALGVPMGFQQGSQASSCVETWKSALLSRCKTGVRLPVELT